MDKMSFFLMIAAVAASAGVVIWSFNRPLVPLFGPPHISIGRPA